MQKVRSVSPIREAQKELTRRRILDAAQSLFYHRHYNTTTMDDIAKAAGATRSTLYLHFKDKAEIAAELASNHTPRARAVMARLKGPRPTLAEIESWLDEMVDFVREEQVSVAIFSELGMWTPDSEDLRGAMLVLIEGMAANIPAFQIACEPGPRQEEACATVELLLYQLLIACNVAIRSERHGYGKAMISSVAKSFEAFIARYSGLLS